MNILVCGGAGYIGSHCVKELLAKNHSVVVVDNLSKGHKQAVDARADLVVGSLQDATTLDQVFTKHEIDAVMHFAAYSLVGESSSLPLDYYENNVGGTICLLQKMVQYGVKKLIFSSTAATYGEPDRVPIAEDDEKIPTNPYGETKLAVERMLHWCDLAYGITSVVLRYFNVAGADVGGKIGEDHSPETHLIPKVLEVALGKQPYIKIFGDDYATKDGSCIRDYIHVTDLCRAHILALEHLCKTGQSEVFNLGNGSGFSVKEVIEVARKITGHPIPEKVYPRRAGDPARLITNSGKMSSLGWKCEYSSLGQIIQSAWDFHRAHPDGYQGIPD